ncbi:MAG: RpiB/LacA/LacB family sugar-phosphate isomerase [Spirochaetales bacterium]|jgi:ribose 5-phosphate isomerase B|nr:RpiB/LacA/LacB family sugar-phosphate isomerase [Spirochaetales bacterium]
MKLAIGSDPNAESLKKTIIEHVRSLGHDIEDFGGDDPIYANVAFSVSEAVAAGSFTRGILVCGTGIGMSIAANKVPGVNAALCSDAYSAERSIKSNNANVMTMGAQVTGVELAKTLVEVWLQASFDANSRSASKARRIDQYAKEHQG